MSSDLDIALLQSIEARIALLERARNMTFCGAHEPKHYVAGSVTQRGGATYVALTSTTETPGSSDHWRRLGLNK